MSIPLTTSNVYFGWVLAVTAFRVLMYFIRLEDVAKVKIDEKAWEDAKVREVTFAWVKGIRILMSFRMVVLAVCLIMDEGLAKSSMVTVNFGLDLFLMYSIYRNFILVGKGHKIIVHRSPIPPAAIQFSVVLAGLAYYSYTFFIQKN